MKLSTKGRYASRIMLCIARHEQDGPVPKKRIAEQEGISTDYIEQIIVPLKNAGLVVSTRGLRGGFQLAKSAVDITLYEILEATEGDEIAKMLTSNKALILQNHGLLTTGRFVESAAWWFITMERTCQAQLLVKSASNNNNPNVINEKAAKKAYDIIGNEDAGWFSFQPLLQKLHKEFPELK